MSSTSDGDNPVLNVITGPTAAGKSMIAMELARRFNLAIVSADSRQVYRGFDIGTAKPSVADMSEVPHFGIDVLDPGFRYSAHAWATSANQWMQDAREAGHQPLIVGGTGFYVRALVRPLAAAPAMDAERRQKLERWLAKQEFSFLRDWCTALDPARSELGRTQLLRAIETALLSGIRLSDIHAEQRQELEENSSVAGKNERPINAHRVQAELRRVRYLVVDPGPPLAERIQLRVNQMMDTGWMDEINRLMATVSPDAPAWLASGYGVMREHARELLSREQAIERVVIETRQYAKRQRTWCRHQLTEGPVTRISTLEPDAVDRAVAWLSGAETAR